MAAVRGSDGLWPTAPPPLAVALVTLEEKKIQSRDGLEDEMEESAPRLKLTRCSRKKRDISMHERLDLVPTSDTAKQFRSRLRPFFFLGAIPSQYVESHSLPYIKSLPEKHKNYSVRSIRRTVRGVAIHNPVGKITDRKPAFSIDVFDRIRIGLRARIKQK